MENKKLRHAKFHEGIYVKGFGQVTNATNEVDVNEHSTRYRSVALISGPVGVSIELTTNSSHKLVGFVPWTMIRYATFAAEESPSPTSGGSNKLKSVA